MRPDLPSRARPSGCRQRAIGGAAAVAGLVALSAAAQDVASSGIARALLGAYIDHAPSFIAGAAAGFGTYLRGDVELSLRRCVVSILLGGLAGVFALGLAIALSGLLGERFAVENAGWWVVLPIAGGWGSEKLLLAVQRLVPSLGEASGAYLRRKLGLPPTGGEPPP